VTVKCDTGKYHFHLNLNQVDWFHESGIGTERGGVQDAPGGRDELPAAPVDGVLVQHDVVQVEADAAHVLIAENALLESLISIIYSQKVLK
jgi:hypothetical protein